MLGFSSLFQAGGGGTEKERLLFRFKAAEAETAELRVRRPSHADTAHLLTPSLPPLSSTHLSSTETLC